MIQIAKFPGWARFALAMSVMSANLALGAEAPAQPKPLTGVMTLGALGILPSPSTSLSYGGWVTPREVPGEVNQQRLSFQTPAYQDAANSASLFASGSSLHFAEPGTLSGTGIPVPTDLWKLEVGGSYSHRFSGEDADKFIGGRVSFGSASDHPFSRLDVTTISAGIYYSWATSERSRWMLTLFASNNNPISNYVPIPGFVYVYETPTFVGMFGFPFSSLMWRPADPWMFTLAAFGPTVTAEADYGNPAVAQLFAGFNWSQQSYLRRDRPEAKDRLYYDEKRAPIGVRVPFSRMLRAEASTGYAFDRSVYESLHFRSRDNGATELGASWFGALNLRLDL